MLPRVDLDFRAIGGCNPTRLGLIGTTGMQLAELTFN